MIRRMIWLAIGAVLGVSGYRRLTRAAKSLVGPRAHVPAGQQSPGGQVIAMTSNVAGWLAPLARRRRRPPRRVGTGAASFIRDVRTGMAEYMDTHGG